MNKEIKNLIEKKHAQYENLINEWSIYKNDGSCDLSRILNLKKQYLSVEVVYDPFIDEIRRMRIDDEFEAYKNKVMTDIEFQKRELFLEDAEDIEELLEYKKEGITEKWFDHLICEIEDMLSETEEKEYVKYFDVLIERFIEEHFDDIIAMGTGYINE